VVVGCWLLVVGCWYFRPNQRLTYQTFKVLKTLKVFHPRYGKNTLIDLKTPTTEVVQNKWQKKHNNEWLNKTNKTLG